MKRSYLLPIVAFALPIITLAQADGLFGILGRIRGLLAALVPIIIGLAVLYFLWGVLKYVTSSDAAKQKEATGTMVTGVVVLFVMVSVWGLVGLLQDTFDVDQSAAPTDIRLIP